MTQTPTDKSSHNHPKGIGKALGRIPSGLYILTSRFEDRQTGMLVSWVQQVCFEPPMVVVAIGKGRPILPLISDSRRFGLCQIPEDDKLLLRRFAGGVDTTEDPFLSMDMLDNGAGGVPIMNQALTWMECEVACHMDVEGDHDLFVGRVLRAGGQEAGKPRVHLREDGFKY